MPLSLLVLGGRGILSPSYSDMSGVFKWLSNAHIYTYAYTQTHTYTHIYTHIHAYTDTYTRIHIHTHAVGQ